MVFISLLGEVFFFKKNLQVTWIGAMCVVVCKGCFCFSGWVDTFGYIRNNFSLDVATINGKCS
jgi:hypothetical protein